MVVGFLGLGEIGSAYSIGLAQEGVVVKGYDILMENPSYAGRFDKCAEGGVKLASDIKELVEGSDVIIAVTTSHVAIQTAEAAKPYLKPGQIYLELNSATPMVKEQIRDSLKGIDIVDGATMESPTKKHKTLVFVSGERGKEVADKLNDAGMNLRFVGEKFGTASGIKIIRSVYTKGMEAALMECMHAAYVLGIEDGMFSTICELFHASSIENMLTAMVRTNAIHSKRRGEEVGGCVDVLKELGVDSTMSEASAKKLLWIASLGIKEHFNGYVPDDMKLTLEEISKHKV